MKFNNLKEEEEEEEDIKNNNSISNNNNNEENNNLIELQDVNLIDSPLNKNKNKIKKSKNKKYLQLKETNKDTEEEEEEEDDESDDADNVKLHQFNDNNTNSTNINEYEDITIPSDIADKIGFGGQKSLEENANIFSKITYFWCDRFIYHCFKNVLQLDHIWDLASYDKADYLFKTFDINWQKELKNNPKNPSFYKAAFQSFGKYFMLSWFYFGLNTISQFIGPQLLRLIVSYVIKYRNDPTSIDPNWGYYYALIMFANAMFGSICLYQSNMISARTGNRLKSIIVLNVYKKSLKLTNKSKSIKSNGEIVNLMSNDAQRLLEMFQMINTLVFALPMIVVSMVLLYLCIGWVSFISLIILGLSLPFNSLQGSKISTYRRRLVGCTDQRVKIISEMFQAIKTIKLYAWEESFAQKLLKKRAEEIVNLKRLFRLRYSLIIVVQSLPTLVSIVMFSVYYMVYKELPADKIFAAVAYLNILRVPFNFLPYAYNIYIQFKVSIVRVVDFLSLDEINQGDDNQKEININVNEIDKKIQLENGIYIKNATFSWNGKSTSKDDDKTPGGDNSSGKGKGKGRGGKGRGGNNNNNGGVDVFGHQYIPVVSNYRLKNLNVEINEKGTLFMVIGPVGSGKSSVCQAILGEMEMENDDGSLRVVGSIAYVSQTSWIMNATLRDNILFGKPFNQEKYDMVLSVCALLPDIALFPQGDQVEIGERGINLSGGQKSRVSIARAVYSDADIYVLDDILSAVDAHVGKHLFYNCIRGALKDKIVVLATNQLNYCPHSNKTLILSSNGEVEHYGTFESIIQNLNNNNMTNSNFSELLKQYAIIANNSSDKDSENNDDDDQAVVVVKDEVIKKNNNNESLDGKLVSEEEREEGAVSFKHYLYYFTAGGKYLFLASLIGYFADTAASTFTTWWLSNWSSKHDYSNVDNIGDIGSSIGNSIDIIGGSSGGSSSGKETGMLNPGEFIGIFIGLGLASMVLLAARTIAFFEYTVRSATEIHKRLFFSIIRAPMWFFDTVPLGRILNRFTRDTDILDMLMTNSVQQFLNFSTNVLAILVIVSIVTPYLLVPLIPIIFMFYLLQHFYRSTSIQVQRLESISRSPIFSHFSESLGGVITLRAFRKSNENVLKNQSLLDDNNKCYITLQATNQWLGLRLSVLSNLVTLFSCIFITLERSTIAVASVGLSISYALSLTNNLNKSTQQLAEMETKMNSMERISYYTSNVPQEPDQIIHSNRPPVGWPNCSDSNTTTINGGGGRSPVIFENVVMSYRTGLPPVLKGISFEIKPKEKIGICGRTGSGKSSLLLALFRLVEITSGKIILDGIDISTIGLRDLRSQLAIIPQDPIMFTGTLRSNLDPLSEHSDADLWEVLKEIQLYDQIKSITTTGSADSSLDVKVLEGGDNFSVGQRQLICLGRALLKKPALLVLDEATASVDTLSDALIQKIIRDKFENAIILTIAHRLDTIMDSDRILVLDSGEISEFDKPSVLVQNQNSLLNWLVNETGDQNAQYLKSLIKY